MISRLVLVLWCVVSIHTAWSERLAIVADEWPPMDALAEFLQTEAKYSIDKFDQKDLPSDLSTYYAAFMYIHSTMTDQTEKGLIDYAQNGGRLIGLHHGIASGRLNNPKWLEFTGIHLSPRDHPLTPWKVIANTTHTVVNLHPHHYITSHNVIYPRKVEYRSTDTLSQPGWFPAFDLENTEVFLNQQFTDGREKTILFGFLCVDPETGKQIMQDRCGWYKRSGKGWLFYIQPGHAVSDFQNRNLLQAIWNCLTWNP